jgi:hypothetical protein
MAGPLRHQISRLRVGDTIWVQVVERIEASFFIVDFNGDLLRIKNETRMDISEGESVPLEVVAIHPLKFRHSARSGRRGFNITV